MHFDWTSIYRHYRAFSDWFKTSEMISSILLGLSIPPAQCICWAFCYDILAWCPIWTPCFSALLCWPSALFTPKLLGRIFWDTLDRTASVHAMKGDQWTYHGVIYTDATDMAHTDGVHWFLNRRAGQTSRSGRTVTGPSLDNRDRASHCWYTARDASFPASPRLRKKGRGRAVVSASSRRGSTCAPTGESLIEGQ